MPRGGCLFPESPAFFQLMAKEECRLWKAKPFLLFPPCFLSSQPYSTEILGGDELTATLTCGAPGPSHLARGSPGETEAQGDGYVEVLQLFHGKEIASLCMGPLTGTSRTPEQARLMFPQFQSWEPEAQRGCVAGSGCTAPRTGPSLPWGNAHAGAETLPCKPVSLAPVTRVPR